MSTIVTLLLLLAPVLLVLVLRSNAALLFAPLCIGFTVVHYVSSHEISTQLAPYIGPARENHIQLILAFLPAVIILLATIKSAEKGLTGLIVQLFPAIGVGFLTIALALPFLPAELKGDIISSDLWNFALKLQAPIIGFAALASLVLLARSHFSSGGLFKREKHSG